jgi:ribosome-binding ATPase YchF (GTP1/OBG family)
MAHGFIAAEVIGCDTLFALGSLAKAREKGALKLEGRDYVVRDGDVVQFRFHG